MKIFRIALAIGIFVLIGTTVAHGWVEDPPARQRICSEQGGSPSYTPKQTNMLPTSSTTKTKVQ